MDEVKTDHRQLAIAVGMEVYSRLIIRSPVDTGRFRGNWMIATGIEPQGADLNRFDKTGQTTIAGGTSNLLQFQTGQTIMIRNNLPYGPSLEYGHSKQAPLGMVRITANELNEIVRNVGAGLAAKGAR